MSEPPVSGQPPYQGQNPYEGQNPYQGQNPSEGQNPDQAPPPYPPGPPVSSAPPAPAYPPAPVYPSAPAYPQYPPAPQYPPPAPYGAAPPTTPMPMVPPGPPMPPGMPPGAYPGAYPGGPIQPAPKKSNKTLIIVLSIVGALLLLCCIGVVAVVAVSRNVDTLTIDEPTNGTSPGRTAGGGTTAGGGGGGGGTVGPQGQKFNLAPGTTASFTDDDGSWTVRVVSVTWRATNCETNPFFPPPDGKLLIVDVAFEVKSGRASINPLYFDYLDSGGKEGDLAILTGCDEPNLDSGNDLPTGTRRAGKIVFDVTGSQTGVVQYQANFEPAASWKVTR